MTTVGACFIPKEYITMLWPLSWDDGHCRSMFHYLAIKKHALTVVMRWWQLTEHRSYLIGYNHALTVVMRRWQLKEHDSYRRDILQCSDRCHQTMATGRACFIPQKWITILCPLSSDDDNCRSMFHSWMIYNHALTVVMRRLQLSEHVSYLRDILPCSDRCHETITTVEACFIVEWYITMLWPLSCDDDNCRSMFHTSRDIWPCSERFHKTIKTVGACFIPKWYIIMLWLLSCDDDNYQSMFHT